jgi:hypothetical protein
MSSARIRELNDAYRCFGAGKGRTMYTKTLCDLGVGFQLAALLCVKNYNSFTPGNDPHGEHDFGSFELDGEKVYWKIDYYDRYCEYGSEDPADPDQTCRVLTIMLASDY